MQVIVERIRHGTPQPEVSAPSLESREAFKTAVGERFRQARLKRGITISTVADATGISPSSISRFENGVTNLDIQSVWAIACTLGLDLEGNGDSGANDN